MRIFLPALFLLACGCQDAQRVARQKCGYGAGDLPATTLADYGTTGEKIPIDHIILVMQENRSFDHYFSSLKVPGQTVDGASPDVTNPDPTHPGGTIQRFHQTSYCFDNPAEEWDDIHKDLDHGKLDGFTAQNAADDPVHDPTGRRALGYFDESDLPFYYGLARAFTISDRHFCSALVNTFPNRLFYMAGTAFGVTKDVFPPATDPKGNPYPNIFTRLNDAHVSWNVYSQDSPTAAMLTQTWSENLPRFVPFEQFFTDAAAGTLPSVTMVEGSDRQGGVSPNEDPPADMQVGVAMVSRITHAVMCSPLWPHAALFLTWDEQGGLYDHVVPPAACVPDDIAPVLAPGDVQAQFDQYGLRVPLMVVSPYAKRGYVSHQVTDHTSILRFVEARFNLPALTHRDANAEPPFDMFDFSHPNLTIPELPAATIDPTQQAACAAAYPPSSGF
jgi:phospholipase C